MRNAVAILVPRHPAISRYIPEFSHSRGNLFAGGNIKVHRFIGDAHRLATWCFEDRDDTGRAEDSYYVRVVQANGHGAWSSPIWASRSGNKEDHH